MLPTSVGVQVFKTAWDAIDQAEGLLITKEVTEAEFVSIDADGVEV
jgi:hypothetical protein